MRVRGAAFTPRITVGYLVTHMHNCLFVSGADRAHSGIDGPVTVIPNRTYIRLKVWAVSSLAHDAM